MIGLAKTNVDIDAIIEGSASRANARDCLIGRGREFFLHGLSPWRKARSDRAARAWTGQGATEGLFQLVKLIALEDLLCDALVV